MLELAPGQRVLDACAAPGGKTGHILEVAGGRGEVWAVDRDAARLGRVRENLERLGLAAKLVTGDATAPEDWWDGTPFDRILIDAPCSATGVIRRHPDIKVLRRPADVERAVALQARLLRALWPLLAPGGRLVYATCSVLKRENDAQIAAFRAAEPTIEPVRGRRVGATAARGGGRRWLLLCLVTEAARVANAQWISFRNHSHVRTALAPLRSCARACVARRRHASLAAGLRPAARARRRRRSSIEEQTTPVSSRSARPMAELRDGVYYLNAVIAYRLSTEASDALHSGVPLGIRLDVEIIRPAALVVRQRATPRCGSRYQLEYHALSERYIVLNVNSGDQASFGSLFAALEYLGRVERLPLIDTAVLDDGPRLLRAAARRARRGAVSRAVAVARLLAARLVDRERVVSMAIAKRIRSAFLTLLAVLGILLWLVALLSFTRVTENTDDFAQRLYWILLINSVGITRAARADRQQPVAARSRLPAARAGIAAARAHGLACSSWWRSRRSSACTSSPSSSSIAASTTGSTSTSRKGLSDALELGQTVLDIQTRGRLDEVQRFALRARRTSKAASSRRSLNALRSESDALELTVYGDNRILGITSVDLDARERRTTRRDEVMLQLRQQGQYVSVEPQANGEYQILAAAAITSPRTNDELGFVQAKFPMEQRLSTLANAVQGSYNQVGELTYLALGAEVRASR